MPALPSLRISWWLAFALPSVVADVELPAVEVPVLAGASPRQVSLHALQAGDHLDELRYSDSPEVLSRCADTPPGHAAGCTHLLADKVQSLSDCARILRMVEGADTLNILGDVCQIQRCREVPGSEDIVTAPQPSALGVSGMVKLTSTLWSQWPGLAEAVEFTEPAVVLVTYRASIASGSAFLASKLLVDGEEQDQTRFVVSSNTGLNIFGSFIGSFSPGPHTFNVYYRTSGVHTVHGSKNSWQGQSLNVISLPWAEPYSLNPRTAFVAISYDVWTDWPGLSKMIFLSSPAVVLAVFQAAVEGESAYLVSAVFVDGVEQRQTTSAVGNTSYMACHGVYVGALPAGQHTVSVKYRISGMIRMSEGGKDWQTRSLTIVTLLGAAVYMHTPTQSLRPSADNASLLMSPLTSNIPSASHTRFVAVHRIHGLGLASAVFGLYINGTKFNDIHFAPSSTVASAGLSIHTGMLSPGNHDFMVAGHRRLGSTVQVTQQLDVITFHTNIPYTHIYGGMLVYSFLCGAQGTRSFARIANLEGLVGKQVDYWTTSIAMKEDIHTFFQDMAADWTVLELGAYRGYTTRVLSETFRTVIAMDASATFLSHNQMNNAARRNIVYAQLHSRFDGLRSLAQNVVQVVFVDAEHDYDSVRRDVHDVLDIFQRSIRYLVFDDYGTDDGVLQVVDELSRDGVLRLVGGIGLRPPWEYHGRVVQRWEGVVCEVSTRHAPRVDESVVFQGAELVDHEPMLGRLYNWFIKNLWHSDDMIQFVSGGVAVTSRGPGKWRRDQIHARAVWLEWPAHKPVAFGGPGGDAQLETWFLQFDKHYDKFAAGMLHNSRQSAAGVAQDIMEALLRRVFVSVTHEWCNTANECSFEHGLGE